MSPDHMSSVQSNEVVCLPQEPQAHNEAQDLLLLQDYVHRLTNTLRTLEDTHAVLQQTELLAGVINEQDCRDIRTACIRSLHKKSAHSSGPLEATVPMCQCYGTRSD